MAFEVKATIGSFGGRLLKLRHESRTTRCPMNLNLYLPGQATASSDQHSDEPAKVPMLFYLAGLTCTGDNGAEKGFFQHAASKHGIAVVYPDTSPRGLNVPGEDDAWDFGTGAGFYVDATREPWSDGYRMYSYVSKELPEALCAQFRQLDPLRMSITGHSMGGHGALTIFLKNPGQYKSVSAFAPIANPVNSPWGQKAFGGYFGKEDDERRRWEEHDATELVKRWQGPLDVLIDVGTSDSFYHQKQLLPENFVEASRAADDDDDKNEKKVTLRLQPEYDHSYHFIASFADDHVAHAAKYFSV